jgi:hypothetical protein
MKGYRGAPLFDALEGGPVQGWRERAKALRQSLSPRSGDQLNGLALALLKLFAGGLLFRLLRKKQVGARRELLSRDAEKRDEQADRSGAQCCARSLLWSLLLDLFRHASKKNLHTLPQGTTFSTNLERALYIISTVGVTFLSKKSPTDAGTRTAPSSSEAQTAFGL